MVVSVGSLRDLWNRFDRLGRMFMDRANPVLGGHEAEILADLKRKKNANPESKSD